MDCHKLRAALATWVKMWLLQRLRQKCAYRRHANLAPFSVAGNDGMTVGGGGIGHGTAWKIISKNNNTSRGSLSHRRRRMHILNDDSRQMPRWVVSRNELESDSSSGAAWCQASVRLSLDVHPAPLRVPVPWPTYQQTERRGPRRPSDRHPGIASSGVESINI